MTKLNLKKSLDALVLGTAQFGLSYGVANDGGQPDKGIVREILDLAYDSGLRTLDTATAYGSSESVLGNIGMDKWSIITKFPSLFGTKDSEITQRVREAVLRSLDKLGKEKLAAVLAHDWRDLAGSRGQRVSEALELLKVQGLIDKIGVSIYESVEFGSVGLTSREIVQAPLNVLDQRILDSGMATSLREEGGELHVRSVFLQGLLLMPPGKRPRRFNRWTSVLDSFDNRVRESGLDAAAFCIGFAARQANVTKCVVGVDSPTHLSKLVTSFQDGQEAAIEASDLKCADKGLIDPRLWRDE